MAAILNPTKLIKEEEVALDTGAAAGPKCNKKQQHQGKTTAKKRKMDEMAQQQEGCEEVVGQSSTEGGILHHIGFRKCIFSKLDLEWHKLLQI